MRHVLFIILPLLVGLVIYYIPVDYSYGALVRNYLPDTCWAFSFTYAFLALWKGALTLFIRMIPLLLFLGFEFMQKFNLLTGTFDYFDCLAYILAYLLATLIVLNNE